MKKIIIILIFLSLLFSTIGIFGYEWIPISCPDMNKVNRVSSLIALLFSIIPLIYFFIKKPRWALISFLSLFLGVISLLSQAGCVPVQRDLRIYAAIEGSGAVMDSAYRQENNYLNFDCKHLDMTRLCQEIYNQSGDGQTSSMLDPPRWGGAGPGEYAFGIVPSSNLSINTNDVLVQAMFQNGFNDPYNLTYDHTKNLYLYFYTNTFFDIISNRIETVVFPTTSNYSDTFIFPTPLTWTHPSGTYYAIWSQIGNGDLGNPNLTMNITNNNDPNQSWQWLGTLSIL